MSILHESCPTARLEDRVRTEFARGVRMLKQPSRFTRFTISMWCRRVHNQQRRSCKTYALDEQTKQKTDEAR